MRIVSQGEGILKDTPEMQHVHVTAAGWPYCRVVHGLIGSSSSRKRAVRQGTLHLLPTFPQIGRCPRSYLRLAVVFFLLKECKSTKGFYRHQNIASANPDIDRTTVDIAKSMLRESRRNPKNLGFP